MLRIIGNPGSKAVKSIIEHTDIKRYAGLKLKATTGIINYGLSGRGLSLFLNKHPLASQLPMINKHIGVGKLKAIREAKASGIVVPDSLTSLPVGAKLSDWIEKRHHSIGGKGIKVATSRTLPESKYFQRFVADRDYELRVHAFMWDVPRVQKRIGDENVIAWNYANGGHFVTIHNPTRYKVYQEAIDIALKILSIRRMAFGAVDFVVDKHGKIYFLEVNASPGFTDLSLPIYTGALAKLTMLPQKDLVKLCY